MKPKKLLLILCVLAIAACGWRKNTPLTRLNDIESYLDSRPDSALAKLKTIDTLALKSKSIKAKYGLLLAAALDKNDIDTADTRIVTPAVEYYDKHGSTEERLKAYMYLGIAQYNREDYSKAIVSYYKAAESATEVDDNKLLGILYSRIASAYAETMDYLQALEFIDKSISCFKACGNNYFENLMYLKKAITLTNLRRWVDAGEFFQDLLTKTDLPNNLKANIELGFALSLVSLPEYDEKKALEAFKKAFEDGARLSGKDDVYAYSFTLRANGDNAGSDKVLGSLNNSQETDYYLENYWKYRDYLHIHDYQSAHRHLWLCMQSYDSIINVAYSKSAANAQRAFFEQKDIASRLKINNQRKLITIVVLAFLISILAAALLYTRKKKAELEERDRMNRLVDSLNRQIQEKKNQKKTAKFALMADVYEEVYRFSNNEESSKDQLFESLKSRFGDLRSDSNAQSRFEQMLDRDLDGIMSQFRQDFHNLSEDEFQLASYYFAGFDNTTVMMILGLPNLETTRKRKSRLKRKILDSTVQNKEKYLSAFK